MPGTKVVIGYYGTHYHRPGCIATVKPEGWALVGYDDYYEVDESELREARNDLGSPFRPCLVCHPKERRE